MAYQIFIAKGTEIYNITDFAGNITWSDSVDTLGMQFDFSIGTSSERYFPKFSISVGDIVSFWNQTEIFRGIIVTKNSNGTIEHRYTAFDFCFYLNKSKIIKQYNSVNATSAIQQLLEDAKIKAGSIPEMATLIQHIYYNETIAEIINDILQQEMEETGKQYLKEMQADTFTIFEKTSKPITALFKPAFNIGAFDITTVIGNPSRSLSIENMKNSILIISGNEKSVRVLGEAKDTESINRYGLLQEIENVDEKERNQAQNIAENKLKELNRIIETCSLELIGNDTVRAGRVLTISEETTGIQGDYFILSCNHTLNGGIHTMSVELEAL